MGIRHEASSAGLLALTRARPARSSVAAGYATASHIGTQLLILLSATVAAPVFPIPRARLVRSEVCAAGLLASQVGRCTRYAHKSAHCRMGLHYVRCGDGAARDVPAA